MNKTRWTARTNGGPTKQSRATRKAEQQQDEGERGGGGKGGGKEEAGQKRPTTTTQQQKHTRHKTREQARDGTRPDGPTGRTTDNKRHEPATKKNTATTRDNERATRTPTKTNKQKRGREREPVAEAQVTSPGTRQRGRVPSSRKQTYKKQLARCDCEGRRQEESYCKDAHVEPLGSPRSWPIASRKNSLRYGCTY